MMRKTDQGIALVAILILILVGSLAGAAFLKKGTLGTMISGNKRRATTLKNAADTMIDYIRLAVGQCEEYLTGGHIDTLVIPPVSDPADIPCSDVDRKGNIDGYEYEIVFENNISTSDKAVFATGTVTGPAGTKKTVRVLAAPQRVTASMMVPFGPLNFLNAGQLDLYWANPMMFRTGNGGWANDDACRDDGPALAVQGNVLCNSNPPLKPYGYPSKVFTLGMTQVTGDITCYESPSEVASPRMDTELYLDNGGSVNPATGVGQCPTPHDDPGAYLDRRGDCNVGVGLYPNSGRPTAPLGLARYDWRADSPVYENDDGAGNYELNSIFSTSIDPDANFPPDTTDMEDICGLRYYKTVSKVILSHTGISPAMEFVRTSDCSDTSDTRPFYFDSTNKEWVFCGDPTRMLEPEVIYAETTLRFDAYAGAIGDGSIGTFNPLTATWVSEEDLVILTAYDQALTYPVSANNPLNAVLVANGDIIIGGLEAGQDFRARIKGGVCSNDDFVLRGGWPKTNVNNVNIFEKKTSISCPGNPGSSCHLYKDGQPIEAGSLGANTQAPHFIGYVMAGNFNTSKRAQQFTTTLDGDAIQTTPLETSYMERQGVFIYECTDASLFGKIPGSVTDYPAYDDVAVILGYQDES